MNPLPFSLAVSDENRWRGNKISSLTCQYVRVNQQSSCRQKQGQREEGPTEWHSGNNLLNLLLHLPAIATHPEPHLVSCWEKATQRRDGNELEGKGKARGLLGLTDLFSPHHFSLPPKLYQFLVARLGLWIPVVGGVYCHSSFEPFFLLTEGLGRQLSSW